MCNSSSKSTVKIFNGLVNYCLIELWCLIIHGEFSFSEPFGIGGFGRLRRLPGSVPGSGNCWAILPHPWSLSIVVPIRSHCLQRSPFLPVHRRLSLHLWRLPSSNLRRSEKLLRRLSCCCPGQHLPRLQHRIWLRLLNINRCMNYTLNRPSPHQLQTYILMAYNITNLASCKDSYKKPWYRMSRTYGAL